MTHEETIQRLTEMHRELRLMQHCYSRDIKALTNEAMQAVSKLHSALQQQPKAKRSRKPRPAAKVVPHVRAAWRAELVKKMENKQ